MGNDVGRNIRQLRVGRGLTQQQVADKLYVTRSTLSNYENGRRHPNLIIAILIADFFQVSLDELAGREQIGQQMAGRTDPNGL